MATTKKSIQAFTVVSVAESAKLKARVKNGNEMKPQNKRILEAFLTLKVGEAFPILVGDEKGGADDYKKRVMAFLAGQGHKDRNVYVHPDDSTLLMVEKLSEPRTRNKS